MPARRTRRPRLRHSKHDVASPRSTRDGKMGIWERTPKFSTTSPRLSTTWAPSMGTQEPWRMKVRTRKMGLSDKVFINTERLRDALRRRRASSVCLNGVPECVFSSVWPASSKLWSQCGPVGVPRGAEGGLS